MISSLVHQLVLAMQLHSAMPTMSWPEVFQHAAAAERAATPRVRAELLLAVAFIESRFDPTATSRVESGHRKTGHYETTTPPADLTRGASLYCGPLQTFAGSWTECIALRDLSAAYAAGATELEQWLSDRRVHGDVTLALAGHGCGNYGVTTGKCNSYPARVLWVQKIFTAVTTPARAHAAPSS